MFVEKYVVNRCDPEWGRTSKSGRYFYKRSIPTGFLNKNRHFLVVSLHQKTLDDKIYT